MAKRRKRQHDEQYIHIAEDFQQHKYLPGYFTGGRIDPLIRIAQRSKGGAASSRLGHLCLVSGALMLGVGILQWRFATPTVLLLGLGALQVAAAVRILRRRKPDL